MSVNNDLAEAWTLLKPILDVADIEQPIHIRCVVDK